MTDDKVDRAPTAPTYWLPEAGSRGGQETPRGPSEQASANVDNVDATRQGDLPVESGEVLPANEWVDAYGDYLYRYAFSRLRESNAAEEVVQETLLAGIRFNDQFRGQGSQRGWLLGILRRKIIDYVRQRARYDRATSYDDTNDPTAQLFDEGGNWRQAVMALDWAPDRGIESRELWEVVRGCLAHL